MTIEPTSLSLGKKEGKICIDKPTPKPLPQTLSSDDESLTTTRNIRLLPDDQRQIDTPNDHNCLFWSAALALLMPLLGESEADKTAFAQMYARLFGDSGSIALSELKKTDKTAVPINADTTREGIRQALRTYNFKKDDVLNFVGNPLHSLIAQVFRRRVVTQMESLYNDTEKNVIAIAGGCDDWASYREGMLRANTSLGWGGEAEIRAISRLVNINISVYGVGTGYPKHYPNSGATRSISLAHVSASRGKSGSGGVKNHYHYGVTSTVYEAHFKRLRSVALPPVPAPAIIPMAMEIVDDEKVPPAQSNPEQAEPVQAITKPVPFAALKKALQQQYGEQGSLSLPISGNPFPMTDVSLTISEKSVVEQKAREKKRQQQKQPKKEGKTHRQEEKTEAEEKKEFGLQRLDAETEFHQIERPIAVQAIFKCDDAKTSVKRVVIEGRAGVGKTTLSRYIAYHWAQKGLFAEQFDYVFWVPLRRWLQPEQQEKAHSSLESNLAAFVYEQLASDRRKQVHIDAIKTVLSRGQDTRTLLVLDGYDEVAHHLQDESSPSCRLLKEALTFPQAIVTTRDYQLPPSEIRFDRTLVNIGFTDAQMTAYIQHYAQWFNAQRPKTTTPELQHATIVTSIQSNPRLWALAHVPLNLALICEAWQRNPRQSLPEAKHEHAEEEIAEVSALGLTQLYETVSICFLKRYIEKYQKNQPDYTFDRLKAQCALEWDSLTTLAWLSFEQGNIVITPTYLKTTLTQLEARYRSMDIDPVLVQAGLTHALELGFLRTEQSELSNRLERSYYFIHLTFHEYFVAQAIVDRLQGKHGKAAYETTLTWLKDNKYNPRYAMVLGFVAGLTVRQETELGLKTFWHALLSPPHDIGGRAHLTVVARCLEEAQYDERIPGKEQLFAEFKRWAGADLKMNVGERYYCGLPWFWSLLNAYPRLYRQSGVLSMLIEAVVDKHQDVHKVAVSVLTETSKVSKVLATSPEALTAVIKVAANKEYKVRQVMVLALGGMGEALASSPQALKAVIKAAADEHLEVREAAVDALRRMGEALARNPEALTVVIKEAATTKNKWVRQAVINVLGYMGKALARNPEALTVVIKAAADKHGGVRQAGVEALRDMGKALVRNPEALMAVIKAAEDENEWVRRAVVEALRVMGKALARNPEALTVVIKAAADKHAVVREVAIKPLRGMGEALASSPEALTAVIKMAADKHDLFVRKIAVAALEDVGKVLVNNPKAITAVIKVAADKNKAVRLAAVATLGYMGEALARNPEALTVVIKAAADKEEMTRQKALKVEDMDKYFPSSLRDLLNMLDHMDYSPEDDSSEDDSSEDDSSKDDSSEDDSPEAAVIKADAYKLRAVRQAAVEALGRMGKALASSPQALTAVITAVEDERENVRKVAVAALGGCMDKALVSSPEALTAVIKAAADEHGTVRTWALAALGGMGEALASSPQALTAVIKATDDEHGTVRQAAVAALGDMDEALASSSQALTAVIKAAADEDEAVRKVAVKALGGMGEALASSPRALTAVSEAEADEDEAVREVAVEILGRMGEALASSPDLMEKMLKAASKSQKEDVRWSAIKVLGTMGSGLASQPRAITIMLKAMKDKKKRIRWVATETLGRIGELLPSQPKALSALIQVAAQERNEDIRQTAITALGAMKIQLASQPKALAAVIKATKNRKVNIRWVAAEALAAMGKELANQPEALSVIIRLVHSKVEEISNAAIGTLANIAEALTNYPQALSTLIKAAKDKRESVRKNALAALGKMEKDLPTNFEAVETLIEAAEKEEDKYKYNSPKSTTVASLESMKEAVLYHPLVFTQMVRSSNPALVKQVNKQLFEQTHGLVVRSEVLEIIRQRQVTPVKLTPETLKNSVDKIFSYVQKLGFPCFSWAACRGTTPHYPAANLPTFSAPVSGKLQRPVFALPKPTPKLTKSKTLAPDYLNSRGEMMLNFNIRYDDLHFISEKNDKGVVVEKQLGKGGVGAVFLGRYQHETVAIKRFETHDFSEQTRKNIRAEAAKMAGISSNHLARLIGLCLEKPYYCVVMEYCPKGDLYHLLKDQHRSLDWRQRYRLATDIAIGVYKCHEKGIIHCDLKSMNVLLYEQEGLLRSKVSDFGFATLIASKDPKAPRGMTPRWAAPEILLEKMDATKASDIYSLGLVLCELATGQIPYSLPGGEPLPQDEIEEKVRSGMRAWKQLPSDCPKELAQLIRDCCAEQPGKRPAATIIVNRLEKLFLTQSQKKRVISTPSPIPKKLKPDSPKTDPKKEASMSASASSATVDLGMPPLASSDSTVKSTPTPIILSPKPIPSPKEEKPTTPNLGFWQTPKPGQPSRLESAILLRPGKGMIKLARPKTQDVGQANTAWLYLESANLQGIRKLHAYHLTHTQGLLDYSMRLIAESEPLPNLQLTHDIQTEPVSLEEIKALQWRLTKQLGESFAETFVESNGRVDWFKWYDQGLRAAPSVATLSFLK